MDTSLFPSLPSAPVVSLGPAKPKSALAAFLLSLLMPGAGQLYCEKVKRGLWTMGLFQASIIGFLVLAVTSRGQLTGLSELFLGICLRSAIVCYGFGFMDAWKTAREVSSGRDALLEYNPRVAAALNLSTRGFGYFYLGESKLAIGIFVVLGVIGYAVQITGQGVFALGMEILLAGLAVHGYRLAQKKNPAMPHSHAEADSGFDPVGAAALTLAGVIVLAYTGLALAGVILPNYARIDQSQNKLYVRNDVTYYENPKYGVTLRLPGVWTPERPPPNQFCMLVNSDQGMTVIFMAEALPFNTLDEYVAQYRSSVQLDNSTKIDLDESFELDGVPARRIVYHTSEDGLITRQATLIVKKGLSGYAVVVSAIEPEDSSWTRLVQSLPKALVIL